MSRDVPDEQCGTSVSGYPKNGIVVGDKTAIHQPLQSFKVCLNRAPSKQITQQRQIAPDQISGGPIVQGHRALPRAVLDIIIFITTLSRMKVACGGLTTLG